jgi:hypothetical protein
MRRYALIELPPLADRLMPDLNSRPSVTPLPLE